MIARPILGENNAAILHPNIMVQNMKEKILLQEMKPDKVNLP